MGFDEGGQHQLSVVGQQGRGHGRVDQSGGVGEIDGHGCEHEVQRAADDGTPHRDALIAAGVGALEYILLGDRAKPHGEKAGDEGNRGSPFHRGPEFELPGGGSVFNYRGYAIHFGHVAHQLGDP